MMLVLGGLEAADRDPHGRHEEHGGNQSQSV